MFIRKASSKQKWVKKTQEHEKQGMLFTENRTTVLRHRTTMECAEKIIFATGKIVLRFPNIVLRWNVNKPTETDQFSLQNPIFNHPNPKLNYKNVYRFYLQHNNQNNSEICIQQH